MNSSTTRKAPQYFIISISYWANDTWRIEEGNIKSRKEAEAKMEEYRNQDAEENFGANGYNTKNGRKFRVQTFTEIKQRFGVDWYNYWKPEGVR